jgi:hypothetical protein
MASASDAEAACEEQRRKNENHKKIPMGNGNEKQHVE